MGLISDILLAAGAFGAAIYCFVLSRRLKRFSDLEKGVGGAVAVLSSRVDDLTKTLSAAQKTAAQSAESLMDLTVKAEESSRRIELQIASLHDLPTPPDPAAKTEPNASPEPTQQPLPPKSNTVEPMFVRHQKERKAG